MKANTSIHKAIIAVLICCIPVISNANDPTSIPWPVGTTASQMNFTKTLMNCYGDPQNDWDEGKFHCGLDFDSHTESPICTNVLCVIDNAVISRWYSTPLGPNPAEWVVVTTQGTGSTNHEDFGWEYQHLSDPRVIYGPDPWDEVDIGDLIQTMNNYVQTIHTHLKWTTWDNDNWCYVNPLDYLTPAPTGSNYTWTFNPEGYTNDFEYFFLENMGYSAWPESSGDVISIMMDENFLFGAVDLFFGFGLSGVGQSTTPECGRNDLAPERIKWNIQRETVACLEMLVQKYLVNFNCPLNNQENEKVWQLYFRHDLDDMYDYGSGAGDHEGLIFCLTNCGDEQGWENLGIDNIEDNCWQTNSNYLYSGETVNPVLAAFPDGAYQLDITCYAHDETVTFPESTEDISCELHNFSPALRKVSILDTSTDVTVYFAEWIPNDLSADLDITVDEEVDAGAELQVILWFTESMTTGSLSASLGPLSIGNDEWSSSVVPNDTWTGEVTLPGALQDGNYTLLVSASDIDDNDLMDPEGEGTVGPYCDCHHALNLDFAAGVEWTRSLHSDVFGSPKLADIDLDGDLDIIIQSADGWVDVLNDDGISMPGWPVDGGWATGDPEVWASPAIINLSGVSSSAPEILAVHPSGCNGFTNTGIAITPWTGIFIGEYTRFFALSSPVTGDFNGDGNNEFVMGRETLLNPYIPFPMTFFGKYNNGNSFWSTQWGNDASVSATATLCDVDGTGGLEVLAVTNWRKYEADNDCTLYCLNASDGDLQWSTDLDGSQIFGALATGNLDDDPAMEIVVGATQGSNFIKVLDGFTGALEYSNPISGGVHAGASIADIDGDGDNDIVVSSQGGILYCWDGSSGDDLSGFPVNLGTWTDDGVSIGDIDSDGMLELVIAGKDGKLHVINHDGTVASGFPMTISSSNDLSGQPALGDIDGDGRLEIVFCELNTSVIHCVELGENTANNYLPCPQFQHDAQNTGYFPTDITPPATPEDFAGEGDLAGHIFNADLTWTLSINDPCYDPIPTPPVDVTSYRVYRTIPPGAQQLIATLPAGTSAYTDVVTFTSFPYPAAIVYYVSACDGVNESPLSDRAKIRVGGLDNIATGCPVREITHSAAVRSSSSHLSMAIEAARRSNCRVLTDGEFNEVFISSSSSDCIEIDLGAVFSVNDVVMVGTSYFTSESPISEIPEPTHRVANDIGASFQLSIDGRSFRSMDSGRARYIRVNNAAGTTEIEVYGETVDMTCAAVDIQRSSDNGYRITAVESGTPITATVFDLSGRSIWRNTSSTGEVMWNSCNSSGNTVPNGVYLIMVESDDIETFTSKVVVR